MKRSLFLLTATLMVCVAMAQPVLSPLHVGGRQFQDAKGRPVLLHGVMDTPNPYFNTWRWGHACNEQTRPACIDYFDKLFTAMTDTAQGAYCNVFRLHLDPCWTNDPDLPSDNAHLGEADISRFSVRRLRSYLKTLYCPIAQSALAHGLYIIMRPPGVFPHTVCVGDKYNQYLKQVWGTVARNDTVRKHAGQMMLELGNEPVRLLDAEGKESPTAMRDFFQPIVDTIRANGYTGIILLPGQGYQSYYADYKDNPVTDNNLAYAVHAYPGWYGNSDERCSGESYIAQFHKQVPVVDTHPIIITEIDWSPGEDVLDPKGNRIANPDGTWRTRNAGTWGTASTSLWANAFKAMKDHYDNISMTLTATSDYLDIDRYLKEGKVVPAFQGNQEACGEACFRWYRRYWKPLNWQKR